MATLETGFQLLLLSFFLYILSSLQRVAGISQYSYEDLTRQLRDSTRGKQVVCWNGENKFKEDSECEVLASLVAKVDAISHFELV